MTRTQFIALRCASAMNNHMLCGMSLDPRREHYIATFGLNDTKRRRRMLTNAFLDQLDACQDDCARRLLLGRSE